MVVPAWLPCGRRASLAQSVGPQAHMMGEWLRQIANQVVWAQSRPRQTVNQIALVQLQGGTGVRIRGLRQNVSHFSENARLRGMTPTGIEIGTDIRTYFITTMYLV